MVLPVCVVLGKTKGRVKGGPEGWGDAKEKRVFSIQFALWMAHCM
jgi:hypothetical protein